MTELPASLPPPVLASSCYYSLARCRQFDGNQVDHPGGWAGSLLLNADFRIDCHSGRYTALVAVSAVMFVVFPIGVPLFLARTLWRSRHQLYPRNHSFTLGVVRSPDGAQPTVLAVRGVNLLPSLMPQLHGKVGPLSDS